MANTKSALKHIRTSEKRRVQNRGVKSAARTYVRRARAAISSNADESQASLTAAMSALDKAVSKGIIHRNNAARRKSRLVKLLRAHETAK